MLHMLLGMMKSRYSWTGTIALHWRHNGRDSVPNHQPHDCLLNRLLRHRSKKTSKLRASLAFVRGIHRGPVNSPHKWPVTREMFPFDDVIIGQPSRQHCYRDTCQFLAPLDISKSKSWDMPASVQRLLVTSVSIMRGLLLWLPIISEVNNIAKPLV